MAWHWKRWLGAGLLILGANGALLLLSLNVFLVSYVDLENRKVDEMVQRAVDVYQDSLVFLERTAKDWAYWDVAYEFMRDHNPAFVENNFTDETFSILDLAVILLLDEQGGLVAGKAFDPEGQMEVPVYPGLLQILHIDGIAKAKVARGQGVKGVVKLPEGLMMLAWEPVLTGHGEGPPRGALVMGRFLNDAELQKLAKKANLPLEFRRPNTGPEWPPWPEADSGALQIQSRVVDSRRIRSRILLRDIFDVPAVVVAVNIPRQIYRQGMHAITYFHGWLFLASVLGGGGMLMVWSRLLGSRHKQRESEHLFQHLFQFSADAFFLCDAQGGFVDVNRRACTALGYSRQELLELKWTDITDAVLDELSNRSRRLNQASAMPMEAAFKGKNGHAFPGEISVSQLDLQDQALIFVLVRDITERKLSDDMLREQKNRLNYLAYHDVLTGLPNRLKAIELLQSCISRARQRDSMVAALLFDIDRFKNINESLGHETGDEILIEIARRVKGVLRDSDAVARFGGDEYLVLVELPADGEGVAAVAEKILEMVARPLQVNDQQFYLTGSIGISQFPRHGTDVQSLLKAADSAMHFAKEQGRNTFRFFIPTLNVDVEERLYLERDLRQALGEEQFTLFFQPQFDLATGRVECLEGLIRWQHPARGMVGPDEFIPLAEDTGLIVPIGEWVLRETCRQMLAWRAQGIPPVRVAVNISARQFRQSGFIEMVFRILQESGLGTQWLELEFTERIVIQGAEHARNMLKLLRQSGMGLAVDDFGLGYSSLVYLKQFPFTKLKMDRAFVKNLVHDARDEAIAAAIIAMGSTLGLEVVAEGIETQEQMEALRRLGCPSGQGYYLTLPMNPAATERFLKQTLGDHSEPVKAFRP